MFKISPNGPHRLDIEMSGKLEREDMKVVLDEFVEKSRNIEQGQMLYRISDFDFPSLGAIAVELSRLPEMFKLVKKFNRAAVLADKTWIRKISELEGTLFPGLEIKAFELDQSAEAELWLSQSS